ncbi:MAG TPA: hypothetical protein VL986_09830 [Terracidiphilus sp.]|nr:hypothetical protein [Terracidiphilus sp.]
MDLDGSSGASAKEPVDKFSILSVPRALAFICILTSFMVRLWVNHQKQVRRMAAA